MAMDIPVGSYEPVTTTGLVRTGAYAMLGIFVSAASSGTIAIYDDGTGGTSNPVVGSFPVVAGTWYPLPFDLVNGLSVVIGGTVAATASMARAS
jgi:hypothetical protein